MRTQKYTRMRAQNCEDEGTKIYKNEDTKYTMMRTQKCTRMRAQNIRG